MEYIYINILNNINILYIIYNISQYNFQILIFGFTYLNLSILNNSFF